MDLPIRKIFFWHRSEKIYCLSFLYVMFRDNVYQGKTERVYIQVKMECVYQGNFITLQITKQNRFYESRLTDGNDLSEKPQFEFDGGGAIITLRR